jgi:hypothetical protein
VGHGYYRRKPKGLRQGYVIWIKRWRCRSCQHTSASLPNFVLSWRHYLVGVIERAVVARFEQHGSWAEVKAQSSAEGTPAMRTIQRWCQAFAGQAGQWLVAVGSTLAQQDSHSPWLDPQGEAAQAGNRAQGLLTASLHLLAWAKTQWRDLVGYGLNNRLEFLWLWGHQAGLDRLI